MDKAGDMNAIDLAYRAFCIKHFPLPSEKDVADLESRIGIHLPPDYRDYIFHYNGGRFNEPDIVAPIQDCPTDSLTSMRGIKATNPLYELASNSDLALFTDNTPPQILPIGYTSMGNLIFVVTHPEDRGYIGMKIAFHDESYLLASGIEEFFGLLRPPPDSA
jgi:hypothetical protein